MVTSSPLHPLLNEINLAANNGLPFLAISMTVALPDICVSLVSEDGRSTGTRYKQWCDENLKSVFNYLTADDLYCMRCGVLHNGRFGEMKHSVGRVIFFPKNPQGSTWGDCKFNDAYFSNVEVFCGDFCNAVADWLERNAAHPMLQNNSQRLMQYRNGLLPYVEGAVVLA